jgi:small GTP-binding protein
MRMAKHRDQRHAPQPLRAGGSPPGATPPDKERWEDPFENLHVRAHRADPQGVPGLRLRHVIRCPAPWISQFAWSADGELLATGADDGVVRFWDAVAGNEVGHITTGRRGIASLGWAPTGRTLAVGDYDGKFLVYDQASGQTIAEGQARGGGEVKHLAWSPDGRRVAIVAGEDKVELWDTVTWKCERQLATASRVRGIAWGLNGQRLACVDPQQLVTTWAVDSGEQVWRPPLTGRSSWYDVDLFRMMHVSGEASDLCTRTDQKLAVMYPDLDLSWELTLRNTVRGVAEPTSPQGIAAVVAKLATISGLRRARIYDLSQAHLGGGTYNQHRGLTFEESVSFFHLDTEVNSIDERRYIEEYVSAICLMNVDTKLDVLGLKSRFFAQGWRHAPLPPFGGKDSEPESPSLTTTAVGSSACVCWPASGGAILSAGGGKAGSTINVQDSDGLRTIYTLQGHTGAILNLSFSADGRLLASVALDGTVRIWSTEHWEQVASLNTEFEFFDQQASLAFNPRHALLATPNRFDDYVCIWEVDADQLLGAAATSETVHYVNAKVVLVGDTGVGKSGLAIRIAEDRFQVTDSTFGANFWQSQLPVDQEVYNQEGLSNLRAELTIWDFAGQADYHLVHQLFLDDTDAALLLFDGSDASDPFRRVTYWAKVLRKQAPSHAVKYLVAARCDVSPVTVAAKEINRVLGEHSLDAFFKISAKTGGGVSELVNRLIHAIPWRRLPRTSSPKLFEVVREWLIQRKQADEALLRMDRVLSEVARAAHAQSLPGPTQHEVDTVIRLLQSQGLAMRLEQLHQGVDSEPARAGQMEDEQANSSHWVSVGELIGPVALVRKMKGLPPESEQQATQRVWVLTRPELVNQYASAIVKAARNDPKDVGSVVERDVATARLPLEQVERLSPQDERIILEATVELLIQHDLAFREMGLLVFPSQIKVRRPPHADDHPPTEVTYEFSGVVEGIYASLVVRLSHTDYFERVEQWHYAAEFARQGHRLGFSMQEKSAGTAELEIYFYPGVDEFDRVTFIRFITDHLRTKGIDIHERIRLYCPRCGNEVTNLDAIRSRIKDGSLDIPCQYCTASVMIPRSVEEKYRSHQSYALKQRELAATASLRTEQEVAEFRRNRHQYSREQEEGVLNILHLSDLHIREPLQALMYQTALATDLLRELDVRRLDYLVLSGDLTDRAAPDEFEAAYAFLDAVVKQFGLDPGRIVVVPGNHDVSWQHSKKGGYEFVYDQDLPRELPPDKSIPLLGIGALIRNEEQYKNRFQAFHECFYRKVYNQPYPLEYDRQAILYPAPQDRILFLGLNSCWQLDHHYQNRSGVNPHALARVIEELNQGDFDGWLKIAVWHHPLRGEGQMPLDFLEQLSVHGFQLALHGHLHEAANDAFRHDDQRGLHVLGAGTFGAPAEQQTVGIPLQYNLLRVDLRKKALTVKSRKKEKPNGAWSADARWGDKNEPKAHFNLPLKLSTAPRG